MKLILTDSQECPVSVEFRTAAGHKALVDGTPVWESSNPEVAQVVNVSEDGLSCVVQANTDLGVAQISVKADADLGDGVEEVVGVLEVEVQPGKAVNANIAAGTPVEKTPPAPEPTPEPTPEA